MELNMCTLLPWKQSGRWWNVCEWALLHLVGALLGFCFQVNYLPVPRVQLLLWSDNSLNQTSRDDLSNLGLVDKWWLCHTFKCVLKLLEAPCCPTGGSSLTGCVNDAKLLFCCSADLQVRWFHGCRDINQTHARSSGETLGMDAWSLLPHDLLLLCV